jgi:hypothetical protein
MACRDGVDQLLLARRRIATRGFGFLRGVVCILARGSSMCGLLIVGLPRIACPHHAIAHVGSSSANLLEAGKWRRRG